MILVFNVHLSEIGDYMLSIFLKTLIGALIITTAVVSYSIFSANSTEQEINWGLHNVEFIGSNLNNTNLKVSLWAKSSTLPSLIKIKIDSLEGSFRVANRTPIVFKSITPFVISDSTNLTLNSVKLGHINSIMAIHSALSQAWSRTNNTTTVEGKLTVYYNRSFIDFRSRVRKYLIYQENVEIIGIKESKKVTDESKKILSRLKDESKKGWSEVKEWWNSE